MKGELVCMEGDVQYREEIDGLRAVAILAVVFFHIKLFPLHGGYLGVDVFFSSPASSFRLCSSLRRKPQAPFPFLTFISSPLPADSSCAFRRFGNHLHSNFLSDCHNAGFLGVFVSTKIFLFGLKITI